MKQGCSLLAETSRVGFYSVEHLCRNKNFLQRGQARIFFHQRNTHPPACLFMRGFMQIEPANCTHIDLLPKYVLTLVHFSQSTIFLALLGRLTLQICTNHAILSQIKLDKVKID